MSIFHYVTLSIDVEKWLSLNWVFINYGLKALLTIPLLWLFFKRLVDQAIWKKGLLHLFTMPIFTFIWLKVYYLICDQLGIFRLQDSRKVWDVYLTVLFYSIQFGVFHLHVYSKKLREEQLLSAELSQLNAESKLSALKAQLNPHFLYNVFNTINAAIPTNAKNARNMVNELSDLFRYQLKASREEIVPLKEELDFVRKYLDLERERFGERLQYEINVTPELAERLVPPLIIQPLVENSIKHGISPLIQGGKIIIDITNKNDALRISVCDTGQGINGQKTSELLQKGVGLSNTNERLIKMYGQGLELSENVPTGLCVFFSIPLNKALD